MIILRPLLPRKIDEPAVGENDPCIYESRECLPECKAYYKNLNQFDLNFLKLAHFV